jgi:hypothetical protein
MAGMLTKPQQMNIYSGETWKRMAEQEYGADLPGLGLDLEYEPQPVRGVDTLMKVGDLDGLGYEGEELIAFFTSPLGRRLTALAMLYHGYKRNRSIFWAAVWAGMGFALPKTSLVVSCFGQDFGAPKPRRC